MICVCAFVFESICVEPATARKTAHFALPTRVHRVFLLQSQSVMRVCARERFSDSITHVDDDVAAVLRTQETAQIKHFEQPGPSVQLKKSPSTISLTLSFGFGWLRNGRLGMRV